MKPDAKQKPVMMSNVIKLLSDLFRFIRCGNIIDCKLAIVPLRLRPKV